MMKNVDVAVYDYIKTYMNSTSNKKLKLEFGIAEDGIKLAPIRIVGNSIELEEALTKINVNLSQN